MSLCITRVEIHASGPLLRTTTALTAGIFLSMLRMERRLGAGNDGMATCCIQSHFERSMTCQSVSWPTRFRLHVPRQLRHSGFDSRNSRFNRYQSSAPTFCRRCVRRLTLLTTLLSILRLIVTQSPSLILTYPSRSLSCILSYLRPSISLRGLL